jgi:hypothetical protein
MNERRQPTDPLSEIDEILQEHRLRTQAAQTLAERTDKNQRHFLEQFSDLCQSEVTPAMRAVLDRLQRDGGGGLIQTHPGGEPRFAKPSVTLWMSLDGEIVGNPREDRDPYFRLDANAAGLAIEVRQGRGTHLGDPVETWPIEETTGDRIEQAIVNVLRSSAN